MDISYFARACMFRSLETFMYVIDLWYSGIDEFFVVIVTLFVGMFHFDFEWLISCVFLFSLPLMFCFDLTLTAGHCKC